MHYFLNPQKALTIQLSLRTGGGGKEEMKTWLRCSWRDRSWLGKK